MDKFLKKLYISSPFILKKIFANTEAFRRNIYRRSGHYSYYFKEINIPEMLGNYNHEKQLDKINSLLKFVRHNIPFYQENIMYYDRLHSINDINNLPLTSKTLMKNDINKFINNKSIKQLWKGKTSGSTGTPFCYYRDKNSMQFEYALYDRLYDYIAGSDNYTKARISGVNIVKTENRKPPFWYFVKVFNQLQCSAYHIDSESYKLYVDVFRKYNVSLGTGYASAWLFLAQYMLENHAESFNLRGIVTDSEGIALEDKFKIEKAFNCTVYQTYGLSEVGMLAVQCESGHYHTFADRCYIEVIDENGKKVNDGEEGELVITDLHSLNSPFIRYKTGDTGVLGETECGCGWKTPYIKKLVGRVDDYVLTSDGRKVSRLGHVAKPARGVQGIQLIQYKAGTLDIKVLPAEDFEPESMEEVVRLAKDYLGEINVSWSITNELERTNAGKIRYVIRKF